MLWLGMGLGKTVVALTVQDLRHALNLSHGTLVLAPLRVCQLVWRQEALKWSHLQRLRFSCVFGSSAKQRELALRTPAHFYLCNYENMEWLFHYINDHFFRYGKYPPFDSVVFDEVTRMKTSTAVRSCAWKKLRPYFRFAVGLTGAPAPQGLVDLHGQYLAVDGGLRLGETVTPFRQRFFYEDGYNLRPFSDSADKIMGLISDITLNLDDAVDVPYTENILEVELSAKDFQLYRDMEDELYMELDCGTDIEAPNAAAKAGKCLQIANGAVYPNPGSTEYINIHDAKIEALKSIVSEANGSPVLCAYSYRSDADRIMKAFPKDTINFTAAKNPELAMAEWKAGKYRLGIAHPASMGHGVDGLQDSCHILAWFGLPWSLDLFDQLNHRIKRPGQKHSVQCHLILAKDTLDYVVYDALKNRATDQRALRQSINTRRGVTPHDDFSFRFTT